MSDENYYRNRSRRSSTMRLLAIFLIGLGVVWMVCTVCAVPFGRMGSSGFGDFGRAMGEWGSEFGQSMGQMGQEIGQWGSEFGQSMGEMGRDFGGSVSGMAGTLARIGTSVCATGCALGLILLGVALIFFRRPRMGAASVYDEGKGKRAEF